MARIEMNKPQRGTQMTIGIMDYLAQRQWSNDPTRPLDA